MDFSFLPHSHGIVYLLSSASLCCSFQNSLNRSFKLIAKTIPVLTWLFHCFDRNALTIGGRSFIYRTDDAGKDAKEEAAGKREGEECARRDSGMPTVSSNVAVAFSVHCRALHHRWVFPPRSRLYSPRSHPLSLSAFPGPLLQA